MAAVEVSTWPQLKTELQSSHDVKLMADIDMNEAAPNGDYVTLEGSVTIDGNHHVIKNLRTTVSSPKPIFLCHYPGTRSLTIKDLDFQNLILAGNSLVGSDSSYNSYPSPTQINGCRFVGSRSGAAYLLAYNSGITLNNCYFNLPWQGSGQSNLSYTSLIPKSTENVSAIANYCWFREKYTGWIYNSTMGTYYPDASSANERIPSFSFSMFKLNGCYIDGSMKIPAGYDVINSGRKYVYYCELILKAVNNAYTPSAQNVFDCDLIADIGGTSLTENTIRTCGWSGVIKKNAHTPGGVEVSSYTFPSGSTMGGSTTPIFESPADMKNAAELANDGFDIIVPSE